MLTWLTLRQAAMARHAIVHSLFPVIPWKEHEDMVNAVYSPWWLGDDDEEEEDDRRHES